MKETVLLYRNKMSPKRAQFSQVLAGAFFIFYAGSKLIEGSLLQYQLIFNSVAVVFGLYFFVTGFIFYNRKSNLAPKISMDDDSVLVKENLFKKMKEIHWKDVKEITFKPRSVYFLLHDNTSEQITIQANASNALQIKNSLRAIAEDKLIPTTEG